MKWYVEAKVPTGKQFKMFYFSGVEAKDGKDAIEKIKEQSANARCAVHFRVMHDDEENED